eukprot:TRINITY_DN1944_c0_g1_i16.p1 TRINITY_DN1944_c0_g1~~TRINITY_DN1944_c0_g1_i16.p1  ORF type:complete len:206 (-),score=-26.29 TRINITY_DN1944_c0_g1_i16:676-1293(-)
MLSITILFYFMLVSQHINICIFLVSYCQMQLSFIKYLFLTNSVHNSILIFFAFYVMSTHTQQIISYQITKTTNCLQKLQTLPRNSFQKKNVCIQSSLIRLQKQQTVYKNYKLCQEIHFTKKKYVYIIRLLILSLKIHATQNNPKIHKLYMIKLYMIKLSSSKLIFLTLFYLQGCIRCVDFFLNTKFWIYFGVIFYFKVQQAQIFN